MIATLEKKVKVEAEEKEEEEAEAEKKEEEEAKDLLLTNQKTIVPVKKLNYKL